ncbi:MAG: hypothetical protein ACOC3G_05870 [Phycisphaeraceae bacterium]
MSADATAFTPSLKPDFAKTVERFEAWWRCELIDRPPVTLSVKPSRPADEPEADHASLEERWLDVAFQVDRIVAHLERRDYVGDALPILMPNVGPEITSTLLGVELEFGETTSWSKPIVHEVEQWAEIAERPADFDNRYWRAIEEMTRLALEKCNGRYLVGIADLHGNYDMLAGLREPEMLCLDMVDAPELVDAAAKRASGVMVEAFERNHAMIAEAGMGSTSWLPMYHAGPAYVPSCDFWCMLGDEHAREFVLPRIIEEMRPLERSIFHLDGPQAHRHLDMLLELDELDAIQWVYGAGAGPAADWIDTYRRILDAGKAAQVLAETPEDALTVLDAVGPRGVWLTLYKPFDTTSEATAFLDEVARRA